MGKQFAGRKVQFDRRLYVLDLLAHLRFTHRFARAMKPCKLEAAREPDTDTEDKM